MVFGLLFISHTIYALNHFNFLQIKINPIFFNIHPLNGEISKPLENITGIKAKAIIFLILDFTFHCNNCLTNKITSFIYGKQNYFYYSEPNCAYSL